MGLLLATTIPLDRADEIDPARVRHAETNLAGFIRQAWHVVEPGTPYQHGWHIDALCEHLQATYDRRIRKLLITIPPRHMKSLAVSVFFPVWAWIRQPWLRWLFSSYAQVLSVRDSTRSRRIIDSPWFQERWGDRFHLTSDQNQKTRYENNRSGVRIATSVKGAATGEGGDFVVVDDPHNLQEIHSDTKRLDVLNWWDNVMSTRLNDQRTGVKIVIMQRGHEGDLAGHVKTQTDWEHLSLPAEFIPTTQISTIGWLDPRVKYGEPLWPERYGQDGEIYKSLQAVNGGPLDSSSYSAQFQQSPSPPGGNIWKTHWWKFWHFRDHPLPPTVIRLKSGDLIQVESEALPIKFDEMFQSWDMSFKGKETAKTIPSFVVGQCWGTFGVRKYLRDQTRGQWEFVKALQEFIKFTEKWPDAHTKVIEAKANGPAVMSALRGKIDGLIPSEPHGDKISRARSVTPTIEAGNVYLPHPYIMVWVPLYLDEVSKFPFSVFNDQIDTTSQILQRIMKNDYSKPVDDVGVMSAPLSPTAELIGSVNVGFENVLAFGGWRD